MINREIFGKSGPWVVVVVCVLQEALCDMNDQLQESSREVELQLRENVDMANARVADAQRRLNAVSESISDYEMTINKFRDHVAHQQVCLRSHWLPG